MDKDEKRKIENDKELVTVLGRVSDSLEEAWPYKLYVKELDIQDIKHKSFAIRVWTRCLRWQLHHLDAVSNSISEFVVDSPDLDLTSWVAASVMFDCENGEWESVSSDSGEEKLKAEGLVLAPTLTSVDAKVKKRFFTTFRNSRISSESRDRV